MTEQKRKEGTKVTIRMHDDVKARIDSYVARHRDVVKDKATLIRAAILLFLEHDPPPELPSGAIHQVGNPRPAEAARKRWEGRK